MIIIKMLVFCVALIVSYIQFDFFCIKVFKLVLNVTNIKKKIINVSPKIAYWVNI